MIKIAIDTQGLHTLCKGEQSGVIDLIRLADHAGIDQVSMGEHVIMGEDWSNYPFGKFTSPLDFPWMDPIAMLAAIAVSTRNIRLSTGVMLAPLRPAILLAKQLATVDVLSHGRVDIGIGTGWQKAEYDASNIPFDTRLDMMLEQVRVCRTLWRDAPASFSGTFHSFENLHSFPKPIQADGIPILFGVPPSSRNFDAIAAHGNGWLPLGLSLERTALGIQQLRDAFDRQGRAPDELIVRHILVPDFDANGHADIKKAIGSVKPWIEAGVTIIQFFPLMFCRDKQEFDDFLLTIAELKK